MRDREREKKPIARLGQILIESFCACFACLLFIRSFCFNLFLSVYFFIILCVCLNFKLGRTEFIVSVFLSAGEGKWLISSCDLILFIFRKIAIYLKHMIFGTKRGSTNHTLSYYCFFFLHSDDSIFINLSTHKII